jgi:E3 ubiquitin-protein ligase SHPRH
LATRAYLEARRIVNEQVKHLDKLRNEEKLLLTALFNARSRYFKEIQVLSDTVRDPIFSDLERRIHSTQKEESDAVSKVDELERRLRYLLHLQKVQSADDLDDEAKICNICTDPIETGILTNKCGHVCCESCWKEWQSQGHRTCVLCQTRVLPTEVHRIIYSRPQASAKSGQVASTTSGSGTLANAATGSGADPLAVRYNELDDNLRGVLNRLATQGRFGSKIDHLTKHVQHIVNQTGEKSLIFSSFGRGLDVVAQALTANGIRHVRLTGAGKSGSESAKLFRSDPNIHVMLLHSEVQSSGLNLLAASHIHILEPLLNTSLELQAIGRVHRIGQTKETHVWCYYVKDTVEERILALSAYKGQSIYLAGRNTSATDGSMTLATSASNKSAAAEQARQDAKKWSAFGKGAKSGKAGAIRGDITSNTAELLACFFARFLPALGSIPVNQSSAISASIAGTSGSNGHTVANGEVGSGSEEVEDERTRLRRARLAALEQRQAGQSS